MSMDSQWDNDSFDEHQRGSWDDDSDALEPKKAGMNTTLKVLIILGCVAGGAVLVCCGGLAWWGYSMKPTEDPQQVIAQTRQIVDCDIPHEFEPKMAMNMNMFAFKIKIVAYASTAGQGTLMLMAMDLSAVGNQPGQEAEIRKSIQQQGFGDRNLTIKESETREFEIRGEKVEFNFAEAEDIRSEAWRQVTGSFSGKEGTVMLIVQIEEEAYDEQALIKMIKSIK